MKKLFAILAVASIMTACTSSDSDKAAATKDTTGNPAADAAKTMDAAKDTMNKMTGAAKDSGNKMMNAAKDSGNKMVSAAKDTANKMMNKAGDKMKAAVKQ